MYGKHTLFLFFLLSSSLLFAPSFEYRGVLVKGVKIGQKSVDMLIKREVASECKEVVMNNHNVWEGDYAHQEVPNACKATYMHTVGKLLPITIHEEVETYGELEVLAFIKEMQNDDGMLLIDSRKEKWFAYRTIPSAINIPFEHFKQKELFPFEFEKHLKRLGVKVDKKGEFDFSEAKSVVIFCNASWCSQSVWLIESLLKIHYPAEKIKWYRGGLQSWLGAGMTTTRK
jgi:rhodanese-related sulfurtransferase